MTAKILVMDDHRMVREALCYFLQGQPDFLVVAQASNCREALDLACTYAPDIVCMDVRRSVEGGVETTRALRASLPNVKVVAISAYADQAHVLEIIGAGAKAYVTKNCSSDDLLAAFRAVLQGRTYFCVAASAALATAPAPAAEQLGRREQQVLRLVTEGYTSQQIGEELFIASSTVDVHRRNIMRKLNLHNVAELTRYVLHADQASR